MHKHARIAGTLPPSTRSANASLGAILGQCYVSLRDLERAYVQHVMTASTTLEEAATRLGINPATLWRKRKRWGLD